MYVLRCIIPKRTNSAFRRRRDQLRKTRFCSPHVQLRLEARPGVERAARSSWRSCTTAYGRRPVRGSTSPTGFIGPKRACRARAAPSPRSAGSPRSRAQLSKSLAAARVSAATQRVDERLVLLAVERTVHVVVAALAVARRAERERRCRSTPRRRSGRARRRSTGGPAPSTRASRAASAPEVSGPVARITTALVGDVERSPRAGRVTPGSASTASVTRRANSVAVDGERAARPAP